MFVPAVACCICVVCVVTIPLVVCGAFWAGYAANVQVWADSSNSNVYFQNLTFVVLENNSVEVFTHSDLVVGDLMTQAAVKFGITYMSEGFVFENYSVGSFQTPNGATKADLTNPPAGNFSALLTNVNQTAFDSLMSSAHDDGVTMNFTANFTAVAWSGTTTKTLKKKLTCSVLAQSSSSLSLQCAGSSSSSSDSDDSGDSGDSGDSDSLLSNDAKVSTSVVRNGDHNHHFKRRGEKFHLAVDARGDSHEVHAGKR